MQFNPSRMHRGQKFLAGKEWLQNKILFTQSYVGGILSSFCSRQQALHHQQISPSFCDFYGSSHFDVFYGFSRVHTWKREAGRGGGLAQRKFPAPLLHSLCSPFARLSLSSLSSPDSMKTQAYMSWFLPTPPPLPGKWREQTVWHIPAAQRAGQ